MSDTFQNRRQSDTVIDMLRDEIVSAKNDNKETKDSLRDHVQECAAMQKKVLMAVIFVGAWTVSHSPEAAKLVGAVAKILVP